MQESKQETQFRIGGVYFNGCKSVIRLAQAGRAGRIAPRGFAAMTIAEDGWELFQFARLADGFAVDDDDLSWLASDALNLIPGELHQVDGEWVPLDKPADHPRQEWDGFVEGIDEVIRRANAAMIARDGPAKPAPAVIAPAPLITTKPPIAGLTRVSAQDHRVGGWGFVR